MLISQFMFKAVAKPGQTLSQTPVMLHNEFNFPKNSLVHYITDTVADAGIRGSHPLIRNWETDIRVSHVLEGYGANGKPRKISITENSLITKYFAAQKRFKKVNDIARVLDKVNDLIVADYSLYLRMFKLSDVALTPMYRWQNLAEAYINRIRALEIRAQFIQIKLPLQIPSYSDFKLAEAEMTVGRMADWESLDSQWLLEVFRGIRGKGILTEVKGIKNLFLTIVEDNSSMTFNLSEILNVEESKADAVSKQFIAALEIAASQRTVAEEVPIDVIEKEVGDDTAEILKQLPPSVLRKMEELASVGRLTKAEQKRYAEMYKRTKELSSPFSDGTLSEFSVVPEELKTFTDELKAPINKIIVPEHATKSSITAWDKQYNEQVKERHMAAAFLKLADAGIFVTEYSAEDKFDAINDYREYTVKLNPIEGSPSVIKPIIPNQDENGVFKASGSRYHQDTQRVD